MHRVKGVVSSSSSSPFCASTPASRWVVISTEDEQPGGRSRGKGVIPVISGEQPSASTRTHWDHSREPFAIQGLITGINGCECSNYLVLADDSVGTVWCATSAPTASGAAGPGSGGGLAYCSPTALISWAHRDPGWTDRDGQP